MTLGRPSRPNNCTRHRFNRLGSCGSYETTAGNGFNHRTIHTDHRGFDPRHRLRPQSVRRQPRRAWIAPANPDGQVPEITLQLKLKGEKLTGTIVKKTGTAAIANGPVKGGEISFETLREGRAGKSTTTCRGRLADDVIQGTIEIDAQGRVLAVPWKMKRIREMIE